MTRRRQSKPLERVPAAPFVEWITARHAAIDADDSIRVSERGNNPAVRVLSQELGVSDRATYRYMRSLDAAGHPTDTFRRCLVQDMIEHAGHRFEDVYPHHDPEVALEPMAFCPTCEDGVHPLAGKCPWCGTGTGKAPSGVTYTRPQRQRLTDHQLRSLHMLHMNCRIPIIELARQSHVRLGYVSAASCDEAIRRGWRRLGLRGMTRGEGITATHVYRRNRAAA